MSREVMVRTRRALASWQKAALGLLVLSVVINAALYTAILGLERERADWETRYRAVRAIEEDAVAAYGALAAKQDAASRLEKAIRALSEAVGRCAE